MSWAPEVLVEGKWSGNALRFATKEEAERYGVGLLARWFVPTNSRAVETPNERANYRLAPDGALVHLCDACDMPARPGDRYCEGHHNLMVFDPKAEIAANE